MTAGQQAELPRSGRPQCRSRIWCRDCRNRGEQKLEWSCSWTGGHAAEGAQQVFLLPRPCIARLDSKKACRSSSLSALSLHTQNALPCLCCPLLRQLTVKELLGAAVSLYSTPPAVCQVFSVTGTLPRAIPGHFYGWKEQTPKEQTPKLGFDGLCRTPLWAGSVSLGRGGPSRLLLCSISATSTSEVLVCRTCLCHHHFGSRTGEFCNCQRIRGRKMAPKCV